MAIAEPKPDEQVEIVRAFNRIYSQRMGVLGQPQYDSPFSMTEMRVIYEIHQARSINARDLSLGLGLDGGYLSRILQKLETQEIVTKKLSKSDARQREISLTAKGKKVYLEWSEGMNARIRDMLDALGAGERTQLLSSLRAACSTLSASQKGPRSLRFRPHQTGDMGLIIHSHAVQFAKEYGWNQEFEALVAERTSEFIRNFDPKHERCIVADIDGQLVGSVFIVRLSEALCELRLLFVLPKARGLGVGQDLLAEALRFSRGAGYKKVAMWTESISVHAAKMFTDVGFRLLEKTPHRRFGKDLIGQYWELDLH